MGKGIKLRQVDLHKGIAASPKRCVSKWAENSSPYSSSSTGEETIDWGNEPGLRFPVRKCPVFCKFGVRTDKVLTNATVFPVDEVAKVYGSVRINWGYAFLSSAREKQHPSNLYWILMITRPATSVAHYQRSNERMRCDLIGSSGSRELERPSRSFKVKIFTCKFVGKERFLVQNFKW